MWSAKLIRTMMFISETYGYYTLVVCGRVEELGEPLLQVGSEWTGARRHGG